MEKKPNQGDDHLQAEPSASEGGQSFGRWLRRQRELREIGLEEISQASKIGMTYLEAFEENRFDVLPASVFAKGFLRQYATYVGLDPEEVINFYLVAREEALEAEKEKEVNEPKRVLRPKVGVNLGWFALAAAVVLVVVFWWLSRSSDLEGEGTSMAEEVSSPAGREDGPARDLVSETPEASGEEPGRETGGSQPGEESSAEDPSSVADPVSQDGVEVAGSPVSTVESGNTLASGNTSASGNTLAAGSDGMPPIRVVLDFSGECWVEANVDGELRVSELKIQGESLLLEADEVVVLKVGNAEAVDLEVNGRPYPVGDPRSGAVRTFRIDLNTLGLQAEAGEVSES